MSFYTESMKRQLSELTRSDLVKLIVDSCAAIMKDTSFEEFSIISNTDNNEFGVKIQIKKLPEKIEGSISKLIE